MIKMNKSNKDKEKDTNRNVSKSFVFDVAKVAPSESQRPIFI